MTSFDGVAVVLVVIVVLWAALALRTGHLITHRHGDYRTLLDPEDGCVYEVCAGCGASR